MNSTRSVQAAGRETIRTLHVDDDAAFADLTAEFLRETDARIDVVTVTDAEAGLARVADGDVDCVVSDYDMPGRNGLELLEAVREADPRLPFILFTGKGSEEVASEAVSAGVTDYLQKERGTHQYTVLANRIVNATEKYWAETDLERRTSQHEAVARLGQRGLETDDLTALFDEAVRLVADRLGCEYVKLLKWQPERSVFDLVAGVGWDEELGGGVSVAVERDSQAGYTLARREPVVVTDLSAETRFEHPALLRDHDVVSGISVAIGSSDDPWGVLGAHTTERFEFTEHDVTFVQSVANVLAAAAERDDRERDLQRSREQFQALVELFPNGGVFLYDHDLRYTMAGGDELEAVGLTGEEMVGQTPGDVFPSENAALLERHYRAALAGERHSFEDGWQGREYHVETVPLRDADGGVIGGMAVAQNTTERVERERELRASRERYQTLVDNFPGGVFLFDGDLRINAAGGLELERVGWKPTDIEGELLDELLTPEGFEHIESNYRATLDGEARAFEYEWQGRHYRVQTIPLRGADDGVTAGMAVAQDVTERVERDRKLDRLRERSQALMHTETVTETAQVAVDAAQEVLGALLSGYHALNEAGDRLRPGVMAETVGEYFDEPPAYGRDAEPGSRAAIVWEVFERGEPLYIPDTNAYAPLTEPSPSRSVLLHPIGHHGVFIVASGESDAYEETDRVLVDILVSSLTAALDRVEREQRLRRRERRLERQNERLSRFAGIVSHDLRNPLSVAEGRLELARRTGDDEQFDAVESAHRRMTRLIDGLLQLTVDSEDDGALDRVDLAAVARASWQTVETAGASLVVETDRAVRADENRLRQLFENLFRNSVEHGRADAGEGATADGDGTTLTVTVGGLPNGFAVEDDGPGIPPEQRDRVFETGYSTSASGTGLGLSIVTDIAVEHGWSVTVAEGNAGGARFEFTDVESDAATR